MKKTLTWISKTFKESWVIDLFKRIFLALDNSRFGFSAKKLTAFIIIFCVVKLHLNYCEYAFVNKDFSLFPTVLGTDFATILTLFGINEYSKNKIAKKEDEKANPKPEEKQEEKT